MKANVTIPSNELKRLLNKAIDDSFSQRFISEITYRLIDRIGRDYPDMLKNLSATVNRKYQENLALQFKLQRERAEKTMRGEDL